MQHPLRVFVVEDEFLLMTQLELYLKAAGHVVAGVATSSEEALARAVEIDADVALIDIHLADGPTGTEVGRFIATHTSMVAVFVTANPKKIPEDFLGAVGVIAKPYTQGGLAAALNYLVAAVTGPPPTLGLPRSLVLAPSYASRWARKRDGDRGLRH